MQQRSEETRTRILEAAHRLFSQAGYDATGVAEICQAAGVSKGAFYHHFPSKQAIFLELFDQWLDGIDLGMQLARQGGQNIPQTFLNLAEMLPAIFADASGRLPMFLEYWTQASRDNTIWDATVAPYRRYEKLFASLVREGIAEGSFHPMDADMAARGLVSLAVGILLQGLLDPKGADWPLVARESLQLLINGMKTNAEP